jgi:hypothetical protein
MKPSYREEQPGPIYIFRLDKDRELRITGITRMEAHVMFMALDNLHKEQEGAGDEEHQADRQD